MITRLTQLAGAVSPAHFLSFLYLSNLVSCTIPISPPNLQDPAVSRDQYVIQQPIQQSIQQPIQQPIYGNLPSHNAIEQPASKPHSNHLDTLSLMTDAIDVMQEDYFELWQGIWPTSIDWTAAVLGTYLSGALTSLSKSMTYIYNTDPKSTQMVNHENLINRHFSQLVGSYFGQDAFGLRTQAYDDMLWVVLGWLESIKFIQLHSSLHYKISTYGSPKGSKHTEWYGMQWIPSFAHRARLFWDLASQGWDISLCDGGMVWSPYLAPYKNAITNELFITASISMYLYFPGDTNTAPFNVKDGLQHPGKPHDPKYLAAAIEGYKWLKSSNMTDDMGLYVDGYHVSGWSRNPGNGSQVNTSCDERNEMVYTYNQGVLLSGQRGLWEATGAHSYLEDGHRLISNVINATGFNLKTDSLWNADKKDQWDGLGRAGILEEACDSEGYCTQDGQTFKGIFFHHLTLFCAPLPPHLIEPGETFDVRSFHNLKVWHEKTCASYSVWIKHNANAALNTVNDAGKFGMWWGAPKDGRAMQSDIPDGAIDYRNLGVPRNQTWRDTVVGNAGVGEQFERVVTDGNFWTRDVNDRGRGRTVETQGGGIAVLRALWEIVEFKALDGR